MDNHLSRPAVTKQALATYHREETSSPFFISLLGLAPDGVYIAVKSPIRWCALTAPFHPYLITQAVYLCCTILGVTSTGYYPAPCSMEPGLSSHKNARLPDLLKDYHTLDSKRNQGLIHLKRIFQRFRLYNPNFIVFIYTFFFKIFL